MRSVVVSLISNVASVNHCQRSASSARLSKAVYWNLQKPPKPGSPLPSESGSANGMFKVVVLAPPRFSQFGSTIPVANSPPKPPPIGDAAQRSFGIRTDGLPTEDQPPRVLSA